jgi:hypothetical protein
MISIWLIGYEKPHQTSEVFNFAHPTLLPLPQLLEETEQQSIGEELIICGNRSCIYELECEVGLKFG